MSMWLAKRPFKPFCPKCPPQNMGPPSMPSLCRITPKSDDTIQLITYQELLTEVEFQLLTGNHTVLHDLASSCPCPHLCPLCPVLTQLQPHALLLASCTCQVHSCLRTSAHAALPTGAFFPRPHIAVSSLVLRSQPTSHLSLECASQPPWPSGFTLPALRLSRLIPLLTEHQHHKDRVLLPLSTLTSQSPGQGLAHSPMCTKDPAADVSLGHSWGVEEGKPTRIWVRAPSS